LLQIVYTICQALIGNIFLALFSKATVTQHCAIYTDPFLMALRNRELHARNDDDDSWCVTWRH